MAEIFGLTLLLDVDQMVLSGFGSATNSAVEGIGRSELFGGECAESKRRSSQRCERV
ncbi:MAG: hypothetical protein JWN03_3220 [Nocardia sp.]|nr:hypothetical protein [Nocardia sp.]